MVAGEGKITIIFRGVRGSYPMPGPTTLRYGGNTTCQEIWVDGRLLIFDAGTGIIGLGDEIARKDFPRHFALFFSHCHHDHTDGILYFKPAYNPATAIDIFGPTEKKGCMLDSLEELSAPPAHPVPFSRMGMRYTFNVLTDGCVVRWPPGGERPELVGSDASPAPGDVVVRTMKNALHPVEGVLNFRIEYAGKSYVYATDVEGDENGGDPKLAAFAQGADLLAHDGQYTSEEYDALRRGWGHSTIEMAAKTAAMARAKRLAIIHHDPSSPDDRLDLMERDAKQLFPDVFLAKEGQTVVL